MAKKSPVITLIGECMVELREEADGRLSRGFGGDVLNTAVYLSRLFGPDAFVRFATIMGDDPYSNGLIDAWKREGVDCALVGRKKNSRSGLYIIQTDESGERSFHYWRSVAPAREFMNLNWQFLQDKAFDSEWIYLSGISIAILRDDGRDRMLGALKDAKGKGKKVIFDGNYRPILWDNKTTAKNWYEQFWTLSDVALAGAEDESHVFGDKTAEETLNRLLGYGISEVVVKQGAGPVLLSSPQGQANIPIKDVSEIIDTTAAGDSFNAGYLYGRLTGLNMSSSAKIGATISATVIQYPGAIIPRENMPDLEASEFT
ncbi:MAG: sugar kinase [Sneathiella sp.]|nr:sugar kinase [Sneathiella sp.]